MKKILFWLDPHEQSFFFFPWKINKIILLLIISAGLTYCWQSEFVKALLDNVFVYLPNYLTHEIVGHNFIGNIFYRGLYSSNQALGSWIHTLAGNGVETLVPLIAICLTLKLQGGRWLMPPLLYWLATTFYGAGRYAQDARACSMALTSSDMVTNYAPGEKCGDWHHILEPLGLLNYDQWIAYTFLFIGSLLFCLAVYSAWYYWSHPDFYATTNNTPPIQLQDNWTPPNIYTPQEEIVPGGKQE